MMLRAEKRALFDIMPCTASGYLSGIVLLDRLSLFPPVDEQIIEAILS